MSNKQEFNGYSFDNRKHRKRMRYLVVMDGDLDINNAYAFTSRQSLDIYLKDEGPKCPIAVFKVQDITRETIK